MLERKIRKTNVLVMLEICPFKNGEIPDKLNINSDYFSGISRKISEKIN